MHNAQTTPVPKSAFTSHNEQLQTLLWTPVSGLCAQDCVGGMALSLCLFSQALQFGKSRNGSFVLKRCPSLPHSVLKWLWLGSSCLEFLPVPVQGSPG